ncbi:unnamed protein product [Lampetra fluviatilis]
MSAERVRRWLASTWHVTVPGEWLAACLDWLAQDNAGRTLSPSEVNRQVFEQWLLTDLRDMALPVLPTGMGEVLTTTLGGYYALQMDSLVDVSQPMYAQLQKLRGRDTSNEQVTAAPRPQQVRAAAAPHTHTQVPRPWEVKAGRMLLLQLTDGVQEIQAMEYRPIPTLHPLLPPGTKLLVSGRVPCRLGVLLLESAHVSLLGGEVEALAQENEPQRLLARLMCVPPGQRDPSRDLAVAVPPHRVARGATPLLQQPSPHIFYLSPALSPTLSPALSPTLSPALSPALSPVPYLTLNPNPNPIIPLFPCLWPSPRPMIGSDGVFHRRAVNHFQLRAHTRTRRRMHMKAGTVNKGVGGQHHARPPLSLQEWPEIHRHHHSRHHRSSVNSVNSCTSNSTSSSISSSVSSSSSSRSLLRTPVLLTSSSISSSSSGIGNISSSSSRSSVGLHSPPFTYLSRVLSTHRPAQRIQITVKGFVVTLLGPLQTRRGAWSVRARITDGTAFTEATFSDHVLTQLMGFSVDKMKVLKRDPACAKTITQALEQCRQRLVDLCCLMELEFGAAEGREGEGEAPLLVRLEEVTREHVEQLRSRIGLV